MKYIWFTYTGIGLPIVNKLLNEGCEVTVAQIQEQKELGYDDKPEDPETKRRRLSLYDGIIDKQPATKVLEAMKNIKNKDEYFVVFDFNELYEYSEQVMKMGYTKGFFPTKSLYEMEKDRKKGKEFVMKYYRDLRVAETEEFTDIESAIEFLNESEDRWALKGNNERAKTVVPETDDIDQWKEQLIDSLENHKEDYEQDGFILERIIWKGLEFTPEMWWMDGVPVASTVDIENKPIGSRNESIQCGCAQNLIVKTELEDKINKIAFPRAVHEMAKKHKGLFVWDAGIMYDQSKKEYYFLEFCAQRFGWDAILSEIAMAGSADDFFTKLSSGENPFIYYFGTAVKGFNMHKDGKERRVLEGLPMSVGDEDNTFIYEVKIEDDKLVCTGADWEMVSFTGASDNPNEAVQIAYDARYSFGFENLYARPLEDFISMQYHSSIPTRYFFINHNLIENEDFEEISAFDDDIKEAYDHKMEIMKKDLEREYGEKVESLSNKHQEELSSIRKEIQSIINAND